MSEDSSKFMMISRNDPCSCGSGKKYKKCCSATGIPGELTDLYWRKYQIRLKNESDISAIRQCGALVIKTFKEIEPYLKPGIATDEINTIVHEFTIKNGATPAPLGYRGYPKSVCTSVNEVICHGIPSNRKLENGDIINVDITSILNGYYADANQTYFIGTPSADAQKIVSVSKQCLKEAASVVRPGCYLNDIGRVIQKYAESQGCSVVREFVGHGIGYEFHEAPQVLHYVAQGNDIPLVPGMVFTIEPMINLGKRESRVLSDGWTVVTQDGSLSAQFEQTIVVTESGMESLTPYEL